MAPLSPPSTRDYLAALRACAGGAGATGCAGSPSLALRLLTDLKSSAVADAASPPSSDGITPPPRLLPEHYCAAMTACGRGGDTQGVLDLLSELKQAGEGGAAATGLRPSSSAAASGSPPLDGGGTSDREEEAARSAEATQTAAAAGMLPSLSPVRGLSAAPRGGGGHASRAFRTHYAFLRDCRVLGETISFLWSVGLSHLWLLSPVVLYTATRDDQSAVLRCLARGGVRSRAWLGRLGLAGLGPAGGEPRCMRTRTMTAAPGTFTTI